MSAPNPKVSGKNPEKIMLILFPLITLSLLVAAVLLYWLLTQFIPLPI